MSGMTPSAQAPEEGLEVPTTFAFGSAAIAVGVVGLDLDQVATTCTLFFYIGGLGFAKKCLHVRVVHASPLAVVIVRVVHNISGRVCASTLPILSSWCDTVYVSR